MVQSKFFGEEHCPSLFLWLSLQVLAVSDPFFIPAKGTVKAYSTSSKRQLAASCPRSLPSVYKPFCVMMCQPWCGEGLICRAVRTVRWKSWVRGGLSLITGSKSEVHLSQVTPGFERSLTCHLLPLPQPQEEEGDQGPAGRSWC